MLPTQTAEFSVALTQDEISFIIELCGCDLDIDIQLKLELARMWKKAHGSLSFTLTQLHSVIELLLQKSEQANSEVQEWADDIATWLSEQVYKRREVMH